MRVSALFFGGYQSHILLFYRGFFFGVPAWRGYFFGVSPSFWMTTAVLCPWSPKEATESMLTTLHLSTSSALAAAATSSSGLGPLAATRNPPTASMGTVSSTSTRSSATARAMATVYTPLCPASLPMSSARPHSTRTFRRSRLDWTSDKKVHRFLRESSRVMRHSGRFTATTTPGRPAPVPTSITLTSPPPAAPAYLSSTGRRARESSMCLSFASSLVLTAVKLTFAL
mmetsp:Transcript_3079/g.8170  ORF Transcript_3079/g.8170 Transcript_3079/m.8170 type:complete len:228 (-) Transcript_3079:140-823(-)